MRCWINSRAVDYRVIITYEHVRQRNRSVPHLNETVSNKTEKNKVIILLKSRMLLILKV